MVLKVSKASLYSGAKEANPGDKPISGTTSIKLNQRSSNSAISVGNLPTPITFFIKHTVPLEPGKIVSCRYWDEVNSAWSTKGVERDAALSNADQTACKVTHLTDFGILAGEFDPPDVVGMGDDLADDFANLEAGDLVPVFTTLSVDDLTYVTWANLKRSPEPLVVLLAMWGIWALLMPFLYKWDQRRRKLFRNEFIYDVDETFMQPEVGSVVLTLDEILQKKSAVYALHNLNISASCKERAWAKIACINHRLNRLRSELLVHTRITDTMIICRVDVRNLIR